VNLILSDGKKINFDHVLLATQPNVTAKILGNEQKFIKQKKLLELIPVVESVMTIHTDLSLLPKSISKNNLQNKGDRALAHKILNWSLPFLKNLKQPVMMSFSLTDIPIPDHSKLFSTKMKRQVHTFESIDAAEQLKLLQGKHNIWYCGGYMVSAVPLLESGVTIACELGPRFNAVVPWDFKPFVGKNYSQIDKISSNKSFFPWNLIIFILITIYLLYSFL